MTSYRLKGASGKVAGTSVDLVAVTRLGSDEGCELRLEEPGIAGLQAEIRLAGDGGLSLVNLDSSTDILLNGKLVSEARLSSGDEIRIGRSRWVLQAPGLRPQKVLTDQAVRPKVNWLPWLVLGAVVAAGALAWYRGWLPF